MARGLLLIDVMNLLHAANGSSPLRVGDLPTQGIYNFLRSLRMAVSTFPQLTPICLHDGRSWRHDAFSEYKSSRTAEPKTASARKLADLRAQIAPQKPYVHTALKHLGVRQASASNLEADDLAGIFVRKAIEQDRKVILLSADKDWVQLIGNNVTWFDPIHDLRLSQGSLPKRLGWCLDKKDLIASKTDRTDDRFLGVPSPRAWLEMKALMGDISDDIGGVGGIGKKGAIEFINMFGSANTFFSSVDAGTIDITGLLKKFADLATDKSKYDVFQRNMMLMDLSSKLIPAPANFHIDIGCYDQKEFESFCRALMFKSFLTDISDWMRPFRS
jgi:5'-3' exonuclease